MFVFLQPSDDENSDNSNECVVCLSDLRDTLILPCRHLCLCNSCADTLRYQANNCPICRLRKTTLSLLHPSTFMNLNSLDLKSSFFYFFLQLLEPCCRSELWGKSLELFHRCLSVPFWLKLWTMTSTRYANEHSEQMYPHGLSFYICLSWPLQSTDSVPPGFEPISLLEALNGLRSVSPVVPSAPLYDEINFSEGLGGDGRPLSSPEHLSDGGLQKGKVSKSPDR